MSRGPTGSFWGPDSHKHNGYPADPANFMTGGNFGFAQAADFYWCVGINHHIWAQLGYLPVQTVNSIAWLGIMHLREGLFSPGVDARREFH